MKYCSKCGKELLDEAVICPACGCKQGPITEADDASSFGFGLLGFCIPLVGLILYLVWSDTAPLRAKSAGKGALISVIVIFTIILLYLIAIGVLIGASIR